MISKFITILKMIKVEHTLFALPFAVVSACYAAGGIPSIDKIMWILVAMVSARSVAMTFNRIVDVRLDAINPRTSARALPQGRLSLPEAWIFTILMIVLFVLSAYSLNTLCLLLSPVALFIIMGYSYTKRFTLLTHFVLGLSLALAPLGAWIAIRQGLGPFPIILGLAVMLWVAGFDIIYACLDVDFDRRVGLYSIPSRLGIKSALMISRGLHLLTWICLVVLTRLADLGWIYAIGCLVILGMLLYEHILASKVGDITRINRAFFTVNVGVSVTLMGFSLAELFIR